MSLSLESIINFLGRRLEELLDILYTSLLGNPYTGDI